MLPDPLHPAVVHLPIALAVLVPVFAIGAMLANRGKARTRAWLLVVALQALLVGSAWLALETGESQEERVERVVAEQHIESHEEAGERFLILAALALVATGIGLAPGSAGVVGRLAGTAATFLALAAGVAVGHSGGELVYRHGAASVYVDSAPTRAVDEAATAGGFRWFAQADVSEDSDSALPRPRPPKPPAAPATGRDLMTPEEREAHRAAMRNLETEEQREAYRRQHHEQMKQRAAERGIELPDEPRPRPPRQGKGTGPRSGAGQP